MSVIYECPLGHRTIFRMDADVPTPPLCTHWVEPAYGGDLHGVGLPANAFYCNEPLRRVDTDPRFRLAELHAWAKKYGETPYNMLNLVTVSDKAMSPMDVLRALFEVADDLAAESASLRIAETVVAAARAYRDVRSSGSWDALINALGLYEEARPK